MNCGFTLQQQLPAVSPNATICSAWVLLYSAEFPESDKPNTAPAALKGSTDCTTVLTGPPKEGTINTGCPYTMLRF